MFLTEGPLAPDSLLFAGREVELRMMEQWLAQGNCVGAVAGARQTGKTSVLLQLRSRFQGKYRFVFIDLEALQNAAEGDCYAFICQEMLDQLSDGLPDAGERRPAYNSTSFLTFLREVSHGTAAIRIAIILDEVGALPDETGRALASTIRAVFTSRHVRADYARFVFILSGSTDIRRFATGQSSPIYNVTEKIYLSDLSQREVDQLLLAGFGAAGLQVPEGVRSQVWYWAGGHPYLTQFLGRKIAAYWEETESVPGEEQLRGIVAGLLQEEDRSLPHMRRVLDKGGPRLWPLITDILEGKPVRFSRSNDDLAELELAGAIVPRGGICLIRNPIFERALRGWMEEPGVDQFDAGEAARPEPWLPPVPARAFRDPVLAWNRGALRDLLNAAFNDEELSALCFERFPAVYEDFAGGMGKGEKIQRLLDYCVRKDQVAGLVLAIQEANPAQYQRFADKLRGE